MHKRKKSNVVKILVICFLAFGLFSCSTGDDGADPVDPIEPDEPVAIQPCNFSLDEIEPNSTVAINCSIDMNGEEVTLPSGITLVYEGGSIENGSIIFSDNSVIDGYILNSTLKIKGTVPKLKDNFFQFDPEKWNIEEGVVSSEVALKNKEILQSTIDMVKQMEANVFEIDEMDAFFKVSAINQFGVPDGFAGIFLPSDFELRMSNNTFLRVQPNNLNKYKLFLITDGNSNVSIKGGNLIGDRDEHDYSLPEGDTHEFGYLIQVFGASDIVIEGVNLSMAIGDGIIISEKGHAFDENRIQSSNILIKDCIIDANRRNNISVTAGHDIIIENNQLLNVGQPTEKSNGTPPRFAIDIEAVRSDGVVFEEVYNVTIRNNIVKNSFAGAFIVHTGDDVTIENNEVESIIAYTVATGVKILNNKIIAPDVESGGTGIQAGGDFKSKDNVVSGNFIKNHPLGIVISDELVKVDNNIIENYTQGIKITNLRDAEITNNNISTPLYDYSRGIAGWGYADNVKISENNIDAGPSVVLQVSFNEGEDEPYTYTLEGNTLKGNSISINNTKGLSFKNNDIDSRLRIVSVTNSEFIDNIVNMSFAGNGFHNTVIIPDGSSNLLFEGNTIYSHAERDDINAIQIEGGINFKINENNIQQTTGVIAINVENAKSFEIMNNVGEINELDFFIKFRGENSVISNNLTTTGDERNDIVQ